MENNFTFSKKKADITHDLVRELLKTIDCEDTFTIHEYVDLEKNSEITLCIPSVDSTEFNKIIESLQTNYPLIF